MLLHRMRSVERNDRGASAVEYGLLAAAIAAVIVVIVFAIGVFTGALFKDTCSSLAEGSYKSSTTTCPA